MAKKSSKTSRQNGKKIPSETSAAVMPTRISLLALALAVLLPYLPCLRPSIAGEQDFLQYDDTQNFRDNVYIYGLSATNLKWVLEDGVVLGVYEPVAWLFKMTVNSLAGRLSSSGGGGSELGSEFPELLGPRLPIPSASVFAIVGVLLHVAVAVTAYVFWHFITFTFLEKNSAGTDSSERINRSLFLSAIIFGVHPLRVEAVRWLSAHGYPLSSILALMSLLMHLKVVAASPSTFQTTKGRIAHEARRLGSYFFLFCAVLSKASCVTVSLVHLVVTIAIVGRAKSSSSSSSSSSKPTDETTIEAHVRRVLTKSFLICAPLFGISMVGTMLAVRAAAADPQPMITHKGVNICVRGFTPRLLRAALALEHYMKKTFLPLRLKYRYYAPEDLSFANPRCVAATCVVASLLFLLLLGAVRRTRAAATSGAKSGAAVERCWAWWSLLGACGCWIGLLLPTLGLHGDHVCSMASDRYTYLPHLMVMVPGVAALVEVALAAVEWLLSKRAGVVGEASSSSSSSSNNSTRVPGLVPLLGLVAIACALGWETGFHACLPWRSSEALWRHAIMVDPGDEKAYLNLAMAISQNHTRLPEAIELYEEAIALNPLEAEAFSNMGVLLAATGKNSEAEAIFGKALKLDPTHWQVRGNYGKALEGSGKYGEAEAMYEAALTNIGAEQTSGDSSTASRSSSSSSSSSWTPKGKAESVKRSYEAIPMSEVGFNLAELYRRTGKGQAAVAAFARVLDINPHHLGALLNLGNHRLEEARRKGPASPRRKKKINEAIEFYKRAIAVSPTYALAFSQLGTALQMAGDTGAAVSMMKQAVRLDPTHANAWFKLAHSSYRVGDWPTAKAGYRRVTELEPSRSDAHLNLGIGAQEQGDTQLAIEAFKSAVAIDPNQKDVWVNLGHLLLSNGDAAEAKHCFAMAKEPEQEEEVEGGGGAWRV